MSKRAINPNLKFLAKNYKTAKGIRLAGSSRSAKTWSIIHWLIWLSSVKDEKATVHIVRSTYNSFKTTLYEDFKRIFDMFGIQNNPFNLVQEVAKFDLFGLKIHFIGADKVGKAKGAGADYVWFNEVTEIPKEIFDQKEMRCRKMWVADYNPSEFEHWIYPEQMRRDDVVTLRTTFRDNHFISETEKNKILSYEPTEENIKNGTADNYMWSVYGMGVATRREGALFMDLNYYESVKDFDTTVAFIDTADTGTDDLCMVIGRLVNEKLYIEHAYMDQSPMEVTIPECARLLKEYNATVCRVESNNGGRLFAVELSKLTSTEILPCREMNNKHTRILMNSYFVNRNVIFKSNLITKFKDQVLRYSKVSKENVHDDGIDALTGLCTFVKGLFPERYEI
jgi:PBSX family phage terminase large subunit